MLTVAARKMPQAMSIGTIATGNPSITARLVKSQVAYVTRPKAAPRTSAALTDWSSTTGAITKYTSPATKIA